MCLWRRTLLYLNKKPHAFKMQTKLVYAPLNCYEMYTNHVSVREAKKQTNFMAIFYDF
jgi:hypothetical protein